MLQIRTHRGGKAERAHDWLRLVIIQHGIRDVELSFK